MVVSFSIAIKIWATKSVYRLIIECYEVYLESGLYVKNVTR